MKEKKENRKNAIQKIALAEETRLLSTYVKMGVDKKRIELNANFIREVAEVFAELQALRGLPSVAVYKNNPSVGKETAAGKMRVKLFATYSTGLIKLNRDLLPKTGEDNDSSELEIFE